MGIFKVGVRIIAPLGKYEKISLWKKDCCLWKKYSTDIFKIMQIICNPHFFKCEKFQMWTDFKTCMRDFFFFLLASNIYWNINHQSLHKNIWSQDAWLTCFITIKHYRQPYNNKSPILTASWTWHQKINMLWDDLLFMWWHTVVIIERILFLIKPNWGTGSNMSVAAKLYTQIHGLRG